MHYNLFFRLACSIRYRSFKYLRGFRKIIRGNGIIRVGKRVLILNSSFDIIGENYKIIIGDDCEFRDFKLYMRGDNNTIIIKNNVSFCEKGNLWIEDGNGAINIGNRCWFGDTHLAVTEGNKIIVGDGCMFSGDIDVRTGDSHSIYDFSTGKRINPAKDIIIGDNVWVGAHSSILKGSIISDDSIIATRSLVNKRFYKKNIIIGGIPAKPLMFNIYWKSQRTE